VQENTSRVEVISAVDDGVLMSRYATRAAQPVELLEQ
jgi:hypothetical protein